MVNESSGGNVKKVKSNKNTYAGFLFIIIFSFWFFLFFLSIHSALSASALDIQLEKDIKIQTWMPQGWGFFSKDPREELTVAYNLNTGKEAGMWPNTRVENYFGLKRLGRSQSVELGLIETNINPSVWEGCKKDSLNCLNKASVAGKVTNTIPNASLCGDIGFVKQRPVPWAWSKHSNNIDMPSKIVRVNVVCSRN
ncbi:SdpA family antimicrobial peptide system protein [Rummeliibacillus suwonensis]|uniref:SdpA family antimicrobial peptide system protein n=1 Tax=Rummeliibacillus suwonensis TaxID=1306154 RepID=UPI0028A14F74|nr:SdpA family antimicrobial peptide system protein [Rummeliibacillus suwonensis]